MAAAERRRDSSLTALLLDVADARGGADALVVDDQRLSFDQLAQRIRQTMAALRAAGVGPGSCVLLLLHNGESAVVTFFAAIGVGASVSPVDPKWRANEIESTLRDARPSVIVAEGRTPRLDLPRLLSRMPAGLVEPDRCVIDAEDPEFGIPLNSFLATGTTATGQRSGADPVNDTDVAVRYYTSGTSGNPRSVSHSHRGLISSLDALESTHSAFFRQGLRNPAAMLRLLRTYRTRLLRPAMGRQVWMTPLSFYGVAGNSLLVQSLCTGQTLVTTRYFEPFRLLTLVARERVTTLAMSPPMADLTLKALERKPDKYDTSSLLVVGLGGSSVPPDLARRLHDRFGAAVAIGYGSTELGGGVTATHLLDPQDMQAQTVGKPFPGVEFKIVDDEGAAVVIGEAGELLCRAPHLQASGGSIPDMDDAGWYHTGDIACEEPGGYLRIIGRKRDVINRNSVNVYPEEIEAVFDRHPSVERVCVFGVPAGAHSDDIVAVVQLVNGATESDEGFREYLISRLSHIKLPDVIQIATSLPTSGDGKIRKGLVRQEYLDQPNPRVAGCDR